MKGKGAGRPCDVALIGLACRFPGARDAASFWREVVAGRDCTGDDLPDRRDPAAHGTRARAAVGGDPEQILLLDAALAALADAGMDGGVPDGHRVELVIGRVNDFNRGDLTRLQHGRIVAQTLAILRQLHPEWTAATWEKIRVDLEASLPPFEAGPSAGAATDLAGRVASHLNLDGASYVVDAAGASSLVALDLGARALAGRRADLALVGGLYLAADGHFPRVFGGTVPGGGVGVVVLKRLADAERDGDRVYAVLKGVGLAGAGRGLDRAAPAARGLARAIRRAYRRSGVDPATVGLVEGHGLGVPATERAELRALHAVFPARERGRRYLGALSANIGHAPAAAGMAALIKAALALHHRVLPPARFADDPHPLLAAPDGPFALNPAARPWVHGDRVSPRRAGVNAFGGAGLSAHAVLEEHPSSADGLNPGCQPDWDSEAILLGAPDRAAWLDVARALLAWLERGANLAVPLKDLAYTLNVGQPLFACRVGIVATSTRDLRDRLRALVARLSDPDCRSIRDAGGTYFREQPLAGPGSLAFLYPGEGSQYPGMLADLCPHFPEIRARFDIADRVALDQGRARLPSETLFAGPRQADTDLWTATTAITVVLAAQWALHQLLTRLELRPDVVVGHSSGEVMALAAAGVVEVDLSFEDRLGELGTIFDRLEDSGRVPEAALVAVAADRSTVEALALPSDGVLGVAMDNCPHQVVLAVAPAAVGALVERLREQGTLCEVLPFARAYHTPAFAPALAPVASFFQRLRLEPPRVPIYSCACAGRMDEGVDQVRRLAVDQWTRPVAFRQTVEAMYADGARIFVEVGTKGNLASFVEDTLRGRPSFAIAANLPRRSGLVQLNHLVAALFAQGLPIRPDFLYARRRPVKIDLGADLPAPGPEPPLYVDFPEMRLSPALAAELRAGPAYAGPTASISIATPLEGIRVAGATSSCPGAQGLGRPGHEDVAPATPELTFLDLNNGQVGVDRDEAVLTYLETMNAFLETQRQVMEAYFAGQQGSLDGLEGWDPSAGMVPPVDGAHDEPGAQSVTGEGLGPWIGRIEQLVPGRELVAVRRLDLCGDPVAEHHTLGGRHVSALEPARKGLPVLPFTVMAEMLAQAAAVLAPGRALVALRDVQANKWIRYEEEPVELEIRARCSADAPDEVHVEILNRGTHEAQRNGAGGPVVSGRVVFGAARDPAPAAGPFDLEGAGPCRFTAEELYRDQWLFHGPALRALVHVGASSRRGIEGTLRILPRRGLLRDSDEPRLQTDPIVLDAFTHLLGCWGLDKLAEGDVIFPWRLAELDFFGADPPEGAEVACRITVRDVLRHRVRVDAELVGPDGRVWVRIQGWDDWRFYWPSRYRDQFRQPDRFFVGEPLALAERTPAGSDAVQAVWLEPPADMRKPVWRDVLEWIQLGPEERSRCRAGGGDEGRATLRCWGRIAAKEAVRRLWAAQGGPPIYPTDLVIENDRHGRPRLRSLLEPERADLPAISIAHVEGLAVALAAPDSNARPGIDVEPVVERPPGFEAAAFLDGERALLDRLVASGGDRPEWVARFWCAKEAVAKAAGTGLLGRPANVVVVGADSESGEVAVTPGAELRAACPDWPDRPVRAVTARRGDHAWAWTLGESAR